MSKQAPKSEDTPKGGGDKGEDKKADGERTHVEKEAKQEKKVEETPKYKLKYGDYTVQVHIIECRELKGRGFGEMSDPVVTVECMGQKKHTKKINNNLNPVFDEVLYFEFRNVYPNELERSKAVVKILDANTLRRDVLIGQYDFDLATVYYNKHHEIYRAWAALTDVTDANEGIQGYVKCSVTVLGPDDEQYTHSAADADDDENGMLAVLMPPNVEQIGRILKVRCYEADGLPQMDDGISLGAFGAGLCDPYVRVEFAGLDVKTPKQNGQKVTWNNELQIPVMEPIMASRIRLSLYDWDAAGDDDRISTMMLDYNDIKASDASSWDFSEVQLHVIQNIDIHGVKDLDALRDRQAADKKRRESQAILPIPSDEKKKDLPNYALPRWYILYGAPSGKQSGEASKMNRGYIPGSFYRGRVLLAFKTEDATDPKKDCTTCLALPLDQRPPEERYIIQCDLYEGSEIPDRGDMGVEICIGPHVMKSPVVPTKEARCQWYHIFKDLAVDYPKDLTQCPDVFVYLVHKGKRLSFVRYKMSDLIAKGWKVPPTWTIMQEDIALDALDNDEFPGTLLFSLRAGPLKTVPAQVFPESRPLVYDLAVPEDTKVQEEVKAAETAPLLHRTSSFSRLPKLGNLTLTVVEAVNLPAMDSNGFSDPFCKLKMDTTSYKTGIIKKTLNPKWGESFKFNNVNIDHTIAISVWDHDTLSDDKIGEFSVDLKSQCIAAKVAMGQPFTHQAWFLVNDKYPNASISLKFQWEYLPGEKQVLTEAKTDKNILNKSKTFFSKITNTSKPKPINPELGICATGQFQLRAHLYQARNLPASDSTGLSDPYVVIRVCGKKMRFATKKETVNPHWYQSMSVNVDLPVPLNMSPEIQVFCMDWDATSKDDPMGRFALSCADAMAMCPGPKPVPRWFEMYDWSGKKIEGATILMAFQLLSSNQVNEPEYKNMPVIAPKTLPMTLEVTTLGLRGLQSTLGVHKTFIEFELPGGKKFKTLPSKTPSAESPNFLQVLKIPVDVPVERIFAPCLDIDVKDMMLGGLIKRTIGTASMDLAQFMEADPNDPTKWAIAEKKGLSGPASDAEIEAELKSEELMRKAEEELKKAKEAEEARKAAELAADKRVEDRRAFEAAVADEKRAAESKAAAVADGRIKPVDENKTSPSEQGMGLGLKDGPQPQKSGQSGVQGGSSSQPGFQPVEEKHDGDSSAGAGKDVVIEINESKRGGDAKKNLSDEGGLGSLDASLDEDDDVNQPLLGKDMKKSDKDKKDPKAKEKTAKERRDEKNARWDADDKEQNPPENPADELPGYMQGRLVVDDELEDSMPMKPFHTIDLFTGQKNASKFFGDQYRKVGAFKGLVRLTDYATEQKQTVTNKELLNPKDLFVRLYILRGLGLTPKDSDGLSDPYLIIKLGKKTINLRDKHINNTLDPDFYEAVEIPCTIPGDAQLEITVMDWDGIGDDFIGKTIIDIEDRWFNKQWRKLPKKPVERRTLHSPSSNHAQGKLELWMEILTPLQSKKEPIIYIKPPPPSNWELRVIVWGVRDVPNFDEWTDQNDLYVTGRCTYPGLKMQETDTHLRAKNGKGNFNWRMKFPIQLPVKTWPRLQFQIWDKDFFSANDSICEAQISLKALCKRALKKRDRVKVYMKRSDRFWLEKLSHPNKPGKNMGRMEISIELMPAEIAAQLPAGFGRSDPNTNPYLPPPEGRVNWSLFHPFAMCKEILGANLYRKVCLGCWCTLFIAACIFMAPMIVSNVFSNLITKF